MILGLWQLILRVFKTSKGPVARKLEIGFLGILNIQCQ